MVLNAGDTFFHATGDAALAAIVRQGIHNVSNNWGGGQLGPGFYAATTLAGAALYLANQQAGGVVEICLTRQLNGVAVAPPVGFNWVAAGRNVELKQLCMTNDYLFEANINPVLEYKFNYRCTRSLRISSVHRWQNGAWARETPEEYLTFYRDQIMMLDDDDPVW